MVIMGNIVDFVRVPKDDKCFHHNPYFQKNNKYAEDR